ncbi:hypothetical protein F5B18DRAFT_114636 [Nemania serpens]|nr:hypothetical protein F5B18DRAFT_114636 [Nemania serpens]
MSLACWFIKNPSISHTKFQNFSAPFLLISQQDLSFNTRYYISISSTPYISQPSHIHHPLLLCSNAVFLTIPTRQVIADIIYSLSPSNACTTSTMPEPQVTGPASPATSFPKFPELPAELRIIIWEMSMEPRSLYFFPPPPGHTQRVLTLGNTRFIEVPEFFFVNWECRYIAFKKYRVISVNIIFHTKAAPGYLFVQRSILVQNDDRMLFDTDYGVLVSTDHEEPLELLGDNEGISGSPNPKKRIRVRWRCEHRCLIASILERGNIGYLQYGLYRNTEHRSQISLGNQVAKRRNTRELDG